MIAFEIVYLFNNYKGTSSSVCTDACLLLLFAVMYYKELKKDKKDEIFTYIDRNKSEKWFDLNE